MSAKRSILKRIGDRLRSGKAYKCGYCSQQFERERLNCPACGCSEITKRY